jgi:hypothetical protein
MPIDYKKYPSNWKSEIRPFILKRANNMCEKCGVQNHILIIRGEWGGEECYQDMDGTIWSYPKGARIGADYVGEVHPTNKLVKVVLTIAHLDHNI